MATSRLIPLRHRLHPHGEIGSAGHLCVGGTISRFSRFAQNTGNVGAILGVVDVVHIPSPTGTIAIAPGETWNFQAWHRDGASSNFTDAVAVTFE